MSQVSKCSVVSEIFAILYCHMSVKRRNPPPLIIIIVWPL